MSTAYRVRRFRRNGRVGAPCTAHPVTLLDISTSLNFMWRVRYYADVQAVSVIARSSSWPFADGKLSSQLATALRAAQSAGSSMLSLIASALKRV